MKETPSQSRQRDLLSAQTNRVEQSQTLLIDADDTLWENNIYFERAIAAFIRYLDHTEHSAAEIRAVLNECERESIAAHGYGLASFRHSLAACFERLSPKAANAAADSVADPERHADRLAQIASFAASIAEQQIELLPGVASTLPRLAGRHRLILMTKGNAEEQQAKLDASGVHMHFSAVEIPPEKHAAAYREVLRKYAIDSRSSWMIGNSPKSDINPALEAGLNAVIVHHPNTWILEHEALAAPPAAQRLLELHSFADLLQHF
ncbi:MAG: HAD family hydrolase [Acidobacteriaceae bacterium]